MIVQMVQRYIAYALHGSAPQIIADWNDDTLLSAQRWSGGSIRPCRHDAKRIYPVQLAIIGTVSQHAAPAAYRQPCRFIFKFLGISWCSARLHQMSRISWKLAAPFSDWHSVAISQPKGNRCIIGDDISQSLGQKKKTIKIMAINFVIILTGSAMALAGKIALSGWLNFRISRFLVGGSDYSRLIPVFTLYFWAESLACVI